MPMSFSICSSSADNSVRIRRSSARAWARALHRASTRNIWPMIRGRLEFAGARERTLRRGSPARISAGQNALVVSTLWSVMTISPSINSKTESDSGVLFRSGVPVTKLCRYRRDAGNILRGNGLARGRERSSRFEKISTELRGGNDERDKRFAGDISPGVSGAARHVNIIAGFPGNPFVATRPLPQGLHLARDDEEILCVGVTVKRDRASRRNHSPHYAELVVRRLRRGQKLDHGSEKVDANVGRRVDDSAHTCLRSFL